MTAELRVISVGRTGLEQSLRRDAITAELLQLRLQFFGEGAAQGYDAALLDLVGEREFSFRCSIANRSALAACAQGHATRLPTAQR